MEYTPTHINRELNLFYGGNEMYQDKNLHRVCIAFKIYIAFEKVRSESNLQVFLFTYLYTVFNEKYAHEYQSFSIRCCGVGARL